MATDNNTLYHVGTLVFGKIKGYPYWPAEIKEIIQNNKTVKYNVTFFGDDTTAIIRQGDMCLYSEYKYIHGKPKTNNFQNKKFNEALQIAENASANLPPLKISDVNHHQFLDNDSTTGKETYSMQVEFDKVKSKVREHEESDLETSLTLAAEAGNLLLQENINLKSEIQILTKQNSLLEATLSGTQAKLENMSQEENNLLSIIETLQGKLHDTSAQLDKEKLCRLELQNLFEEQDRSQMALLEEQTLKTSALEKKIQQLQNYNSLSQQKYVKSEADHAQNKILKDMETQTVDIQLPFINTNSLVLTELAKVKTRQDQVEDLTKILQEQLEALTISRAISDITPRQASTSSSTLKLTPKQSAPQRPKLVKTGKKKTVFSISLQAAKYKNNITTNPDHNESRIDIVGATQTNQKIPDGNLKSLEATRLKSPPSTAIIRQKDEDIEEFFAKHIDFYKNLNFNFANTSVRLESTTGNNSYVHTEEPITEIPEGICSENEGYFLTTLRKKKGKLKKEAQDQHSQYITKISIE